MPAEHDDLQTPHGPNSSQRDSATANSSGHVPSRVDRSSLVFEPLAERANRVRIAETALTLDNLPAAVSPEYDSIIDTVVDRIRSAREGDRPVVLAFGAHTVKNGAAPVLEHLIDLGFVTHLATNGAGIIHDWEFAYQGESSEDVRANVATGRFGIWEETGLYLNLAISVGAFEGRGYGESVGAFIENGGLRVPSAEELSKIATDTSQTLDRRAAALDLQSVLTSERLGETRLSQLLERRDENGWVDVSHRFAQYSIQAAAYRRGVPCTAHPMFGHDIIYTHPANHGAAIGRSAERDFLTYADAVARLEGGVYLSIGSAVMSPMIFEKSLSMGRNSARLVGGTIDEFTVCVVDLAESSWDWAEDGEPPSDNPAYYLRFMKTFNRMGGDLRYLTMDNRDFLLHIANRLGMLSMK